MQQGGNESPALCRRAVRPWAAQRKQLWALPSFLPCFTRGCRLKKYVSCCEQIRFMDLDCWGNHSRTENKLPGWDSCLSYAPCWFISCPEYIIECLMDSLFISELTLLSIYIINAEHMFSIDRESYFGLFTQRVGEFSLYELLWRIQNYRTSFRQPKVSTRPNASERAMALRGTLLNILKSFPFINVFFSSLHLPKCCFV